MKTKIVRKGIYVHFKSNEYDRTFRVKCIGDVKKLLWIKKFINHFKIGEDINGGYFWTVFVPFYYDRMKSTQKIVDEIVEELSKNMDVIIWTAKKFKDSNITLDEPFELICGRFLDYWWQDIPINAHSIFVSKFSRDVSYKQKQIE